MREVGLLMSHHDMDLVPIVDADGALAGVLTERALARRYIRESREPSELDAPATVGAIARVVEGDAGQRSRGRGGVRADLVHGDGHRLAAERDRARRRRRRRQPRRRAARRDRARRRPARGHQRHAAAARRR